MKYEYNKLVRDKIPENINSKKGKKATYRVMQDEEYLKELNKKLIEESKEFVEENSIEELADVMEVIESIMKVKDIKIEDVKHIKEEKKLKKGGFDSKIFLEYVEEQDRNNEEER